MGKTVDRGSELEQLNRRFKQLQERAYIYDSQIQTLTIAYGEVINEECEIVKRIEELKCLTTPKTNS